ncbi:MAG: DUF5372 family protein [Gammaproteobacteria bacterium]
MTHPFHPLRGRRFELLAWKQTWGEDRVYFYDDEGRLRAIPAGWTDAQAPDPFVVIAAGRAHFLPHDLVALADFIARLREREGSKAGASGVK